MQMHACCCCCCTVSDLFNFTILNCNNSSTNKVVMNCVWFLICYWVISDSMGPKLHHWVCRISYNTHIYLHIIKDGTSELEFSHEQMHNVTQSFITFLSNLLRTDKTGYALWIQCPIKMLVIWILDYVFENSFVSNKNRKISLQSCTQQCEVLPYHITLYYKHKWILIWSPTMLFLLCSSNHKQF